MTGTPALFDIKHFQSRDGHACIDIFHRAVRISGLRAYTQAECEAWSPDPLDPRWRANFMQRLAENTSWVAVLDPRGGRKTAEPVGFVSLAPDGYLDLLYVDPNWNGHGLATNLLATAQFHARLLGLTSLRTDASRLARPVFERQGWYVISTNSVCRGTQSLENFNMVRSIGQSAETAAVQAGQSHHRPFGAVVPALQPSTTFARDADYVLKGPHLYSRYGSPNDTEVEAVLASLEGGDAALVFASGMAAIACVLEHVPVGGRVIAPKDMYFAAQAWMCRLADAGRFILTLYDNGRPSALAEAIANSPAALVWVETPANPTWHVTDIEVAASLAHAQGALLCVDGTCAPPCTTRALSLGADIVMHSATKYLNGHSDVTAGVLVFADPANRAVYEPTRRLMGAHLGAFEAWLLIRGLRTLWVRFERQSKTALALAHRFQRHPALSGVLYPGLSSHPHHNIARKQMRHGYGGMLSIVMTDGYEAAKHVATHTKLFAPATSLGSVESLIEHRKAVEGPTSAVDPGLLRLSVGLEPFEELADDLDVALASI